VRYYSFALLGEINSGSGRMTQEGAIVPPERRFNLIFLMISSRCTIIQLHHADSGVTWKTSARRQAKHDENVGYSITLSALTSNV